MMNNNSNKLEYFLDLLGLKTDEMKVYSALLTSSERTVLEISKASGINRTTAYRILEKLKTLGLIEEIIEENRIKFRKAGTDKLGLLVKKEQERTENLNRLLPEVSSLVNQISETSQPGTKVLFYRGQDGIRQMGWNTLKAKGEVVGYTYHPYIEIVGEKFIERWREEWKRRGLFLRDIFSDTYINIRDKKYGKTELYYPKYFQSRYISEKVLSITHQIDIYNDVIGMYNWYGDEIFGVEIYNQRVSSMHKQLFEIVWKMAKPEEQVKRKSKK